jgi:Zn2+/Cd2+-exporting ATPase
MREMKTHIEGEKMSFRYTLNNLDCADCALNIETRLKKIDGFEDAVVNFGTSTLTVGSSDKERLQKEIAAIDPDVVIVSDTGSSKSPFNIRKIIQENLKELLLIATSGVLLSVLLCFEETLHNKGYTILEYLLAGVAFILCGYSVIIRAIKTVLRRDYFDENVLMSIASIGAFSIHALEEAIGVMIFYQVGELLQMIAVKKSRHSIQKLLEIRPDFANRLLDSGDIERINPQDVKVGDLLIVKPGEKIPLDATVVEGYSSIDTAVLTGESTPKEVVAGETVLAGEINCTGKLTIRTIKRFSESSVSKILTMVEHATEKKAKTENFVTSFAKIYTPVIVLIALIIAIIPPLIIPGEEFTTWIYRALVLLVISCPCALVLSIPLGYFGGIGGASRKGILIKGSSFIDVLSNVKHVVFDKTGTLTKGVFKVNKTGTHNGFSEKELLEYAASIESHSNHPVAKSILKYYESIYGSYRESRVSGYQEIHGGGVKGTVSGNEIIAGNAFLMNKENIPVESINDSGTILYVAVNRVLAGYFLLGDELKDDALKAIGNLKKIGIRDVVMLTGDNANAAKSIADKLSIDMYYSSLLPEQKVEILETIMANSNRNEKTAFIGDGINDAPVIARADAGIAMGALGSDAAIETADIVLMTDHPSKVAEAIQIGKLTKSIVVQNIVLSLSVKGVVLLLGIAGFASMWAAVFSDVGVALLAVMNSARALRA